MKVINLFGGPCTGKSTQAADLFVQFKKAGYNVELVTEYAKDATWEDRGNLLTGDQMYIFSKQNRRIVRLEGKVDIVVSDSPIIMGLCYTPDDYFENFAPLVKEVWDQYDNVSYYLERQTNYMAQGRNQDEAGAKLLDQKILKLLADNNIPYTTLNIAIQDVAQQIFEEITNDL